MSSQTQEGKIFLAIDAIRTGRKVSIRHATKAYDVPYTSLYDRIKGRVTRHEVRNSRLQLTKAEKDTIVQHVLNLDLQGFPPRIKGVEDIANLLLATRGSKRVGKNWAYRFVQRRPELKSRFSRAYNFQRALCEDPELIKK
jgi:hypothetical protein